MSFKRSIKGDMIDFQAVRLRVDDLVQQDAIIRHEQQARGILVEAADGVETGIAEREAFRQQFVNRAARVLAAACEAVRFVKHDDKRRWGIERLTTKEDLLEGRHIVFAQHFSVDFGDGTRADQALDFLA